MSFAGRYRHGRDSMPMLCCDRIEAGDDRTANSRWCAGVQTMCESSDRCALGCPPVGRLNPGLRCMVPCMLRLTVPGTADAPPMHGSWTASKRCRQTLVASQTLRQSRNTHIAC